MISRKYDQFFNQLTDASRARFSILRNTLTTFTNSRATQAAASLAYYAIFSLFPLLLVLISASSFFLNSQQVFQSVTRLVQNIFPVATQLINENLRQVLDARGPVGIIGILTLMWAASGVFTNLAYNINQAWPVASRRNFIENRLVGLAMIIELGALLILSLALDLLPQLATLLENGHAFFFSPIPWELITRIGSWLMIFFLFIALYRWVPTTKVHWKATTWSGIAASIGWKIATFGYGWYLKNGLGRYELIYGSLGAIVALLFLIYLMAIITLFGAHLCAAIDGWEKQKDKTNHTEKQFVEKTTSSS